MTDNQKAFIQRHLRSLILQGLPSEEVLEKSFSILDNPELTKKALSQFKQSGSLSSTLHHLEIIHIEPNLLEAIKKQQANQSKENASFVTLLEADDLVSQTFSLLKTKLTVGLVYAMWLSIVATGVFSIISLKVMPQFEEIFLGFGADLPRTTQFALGWQNSFFSPVLIGGIFVLIVAYLLASLHLLTKRRLINKTSKNNQIFFRIPFIKRVVEFTKNIHWFSQINILSSAGIRLEECFSILPFPAQLAAKKPNMKSELLAAEKIELLSEELKFQSHELSQLAEKIVSDASRNLVAVIMLFVAGFVVFTLFASYLPIFQLGAVI